VDAPMWRFDSVPIPCSGRSSACPKPPDQHFAERSVSSWNGSVPSRQANSTSIMSSQATTSRPIVYHSVYARCDAAKSTRHFIFAMPWDFPWHRCQSRVTHTLAMCASFLLIGGHWPGLFGEAGAHSFSVHWQSYSSSSSHLPVPAGLQRRMTP